MVVTTRGSKLCSGKRPRMRSREAVSGDAFAATPTGPCRSDLASGAARPAKATTSTPRTRLCADRLTAAPGCSCPGLLMDFPGKDLLSKHLLRKHLLNKYLFAVLPAKGSQLRFPDANGNSSIGHCAGDNLLMDLPQTALRCQSPRRLPSIPLWTRKSWMSSPDLLAADMAARPGGLRLDPAPARQHRLRQVRRQQGQKQRARQHVSRPSLSPTPSRS